MTDTLQIIQNTQQIPNITVNNPEIDNNNEEQITFTQNSQKYTESKLDTSLTAQGQYTYTGSWKTQNTEQSLNLDIEKQAQTQRYQQQQILLNQYYNKSNSPKYLQNKHFLNKNIENNNNNNNNNGHDLLNTPKNSNNNNLKPFQLSSNNNITDKSTSISKENSNCDKNQFSSSFKRNNLINNDSNDKNMNSNHKFEKNIDIENNNQRNNNNQAIEKLGINIEITEISDNDAGQETNKNINIQNNNSDNKQQQQNLIKFTDKLDESNYIYGSDEKQKQQLFQSNEKQKMTPERYIDLQNNQNSNTSNQNYNYNNNKNININDNQSGFTSSFNASLSMNNIQQNQSNQKLNQYYLNSTRSNQSIQSYKKREQQYLDLKKKLDQDLDKIQQIQILLSKIRYEEQSLSQDFIDFQANYQKQIKKYQYIAIIFTVSSITQIYASISNKQYFDTLGAVVGLIYFMLWVLATYLGKKAFKSQVPNYKYVYQTNYIINKSQFILALDICIYIGGIFSVLYDIYNENGLNNDARNALFMLHVFPMILKLIVLCWIAYKACQVTDKGDKLITLISNELWSKFKQKEMVTLKRSYQQQKMLFRNSQTSININSQA